MSRYKHPCDPHHCTLCFAHPQLTSAFPWRNPPQAHTSLAALRVCWLERL